MTDLPTAPTTAMPVLRKARRVTGHRLVFRDAGPDDAAFILGLRTDERKARHLSAVTPSLAAQQAWLERYRDDPHQAYFVITTTDDRPCGTVRLYDPQARSFCWGSWIRTDDAPATFALESALMVYAYGRSLGFEASHFDVREGNERVWALHERLGARRVGRRGEDLLYVMEPQAIAGLLDRHARHLPGGIRVEGLA